MGRGRMEGSCVVQVVWYRISLVGVTQNQGTEVKCHFVNNIPWGAHGYRATQYYLPFSLLPNFTNGICQGFKIFLGNAVTKDGFRLRRTKIVEKTHISQSATSAHGAHLFYRSSSGGLCGAAAADRDLRARAAAGRPAQHIL